MSQMSPMIVHDLSPDAVREMARFDLARLDAEPNSPIGRFAFHGCLCGVASFSGRPPWECHGAGDELLLILEGESELTVRLPGQQIVQVISTGQLVVVPQDCWHANNAPTGVTMLYMTPAEGNKHSWEEPAASSS
jgi:mannose-6-phosphate isomerase-like protein (cupin superfamily)